jgi:RNA binding exosome subunit
MSKNTELDLAFRYVQYTNKNIFLTGKAGTGKTTFLKTLKHTSFKRTVVVAPTGVAAINAGGVTIHSFFQLSFGPILTEKVAGRKIENRNQKYKFNKTKINIIRSLDLLIIDEISMVRADVLDAIDDVLRRYKNATKAFGGIQVLMIGDLQQLAPIVREDDKRILSLYYDSLFFFHSKALKESDMITIELKKVYRQEDNTFLNILNEIRNDTLSTESYNLLHERYKADFSPKESDGYITLTTHNNSADRLNKSQLEKIDKPAYQFEAIVEGNFSEHAYPADFNLELKEGAQVMFIKNDSDIEKRYFNGKIGRITGFEEDTIIVQCDEDEEEIYTSREKWENIRYSIDEKTKEINEEVVGAFIQFPLRLAWAITIHKSQGLTFEKAIIDASAAFAHGQTYVALSRCKTLEGMVLNSRISKDAIICDNEINEFNTYVEENQPNESALNTAVFAYQSELIHELFNYRQLSYRFDRFKKTVEENAGAYIGNIGDAIYGIQSKSLPKIKNIAENFLKEVNALTKQNPDIEKNKQLIERLKKAGDYFIRFHEQEIISKIESSSFESDNSSVRKDIQESTEKVNEVLHIKQECLKVCQNGFTMKDFLHVKAIAALDEKSIKKKKKVSFQETETKHPELYRKLKEWRKSEAETQGIPFYMIASNKAFIGITNELPVTEKQLQAVKGIGTKKVDQYGVAIISIVSEFIQEKGMKPREDQVEVPKAPKKKNWEMSYELYKAGKSIQEIAQAQGFVAETIENHLGRFIAQGDLKIEEFVAPDIVSKITEHYDKNPNSTLSEAKNNLPEGVTWSQIKMVLKHLEYVSKTK